MYTQRVFMDISTATLPVRRKFNLVSIRCLTHDCIICIVSHSALLSSGAIVGIVVGCVAGLVVLILAVGFIFCFLKKKNNGKE